MSRLRNTGHRLNQENQGGDDAGQELPPLKEPSPEESPPKASAPRSSGLPTDVGPAACARCTDLKAEFRNPEAMCKPCHAKRQHEKGAYPWDEDHPSKWLFQEKASSAMSFRNLEKTFWSFMKWSLPGTPFGYPIRHSGGDSFHMGPCALGSCSSWEHG